MQFYHSFKIRRTRVLNTLRIARKRGELARIADLQQELCIIRRMLRSTFESQAVDQAQSIIDLANEGR